MRIAECHPELKHKGHGLCHKCYSREAAKGRREANRARSKEWYWANREKALAAATEWARNNREKHRHNRVKYLYGITASDELNLLIAQDFKCPVCLQPLDAKASIDHDHSTGEVRGLLHRKCNAAIGYLRDDADSLERAAAYLRNPVGREVLA